MKAVCINADTSTELRLEQEYFIFPAKPNHYYVSRFDNVNAHFGSYQAERFHVVEEEEWPKEPQMDILKLDQDKFYHAQLIWRQRGFKNKSLKEYVIKPKRTHCLFWHDEERKRFCGCFPLHWFKNFVPVIEKEKPEKVEEQPIELLEKVDGQLAFF
ncbi:hypothetical protein [Bacillus multifaciens]|uniref:hypothetical protein n=1 Tax=Bacillus multifaciens TaxID=3068506 RepID=UPI002741A7D6|nr:hypothetical protein [Bacillus sp. WLY-B-L8]MDP7981018.1 hypothetical protein [Bacillus sp. WLY-B-L8]